MTFGAVVMACNAGHAPYALCLAEQIAEAHPDRDFDTCIFSDEILEIPPSLKGLGVRVITWSDANPFVDAPNLSRHGRATWLRLLVPQAVAGQYERIVYLDSDILLRGGGLGSLLGVDLGQDILGAVRDQQQWRRPWRQVEEFRRETLPVAPYFNAGVLLIDVDRFNAEDVLGASVSLMGRRPGSLLRHDQSVLNLVLRNRWRELSPVWNWQFTAVTRFHMHAAEPRLVHFIGKNKHWHDVAGNTPASYRRVYRQFQRQHYASRPEICSANPATMCWPERPVWSLIKHALNARRMHAYLSRFESSLRLCPNDATHDLCSPRMELE